MKEFLNRISVSEFLGRESGYASEIWDISLGFKDIQWWFVIELSYGEEVEAFNPKGRLNVREQLKERHFAA